MGGKGDANGHNDIEDRITNTNSVPFSNKQAQFDALFGEPNDTLTSDRVNTEDHPLNGRHEKYQAEPSRESIVTKSFQNMKNMIKKAKEGDFKAMVGRSSIGTVGNERGIDIETVEFELRRENESMNGDNPLDEDSN